MLQRDPADKKGKEETCLGGSSKPCRATFARPVPVGAAPLRWGQTHRRPGAQGQDTTPSLPLGLWFKPMGSPILLSPRPGSCFQPLYQRGRGGTMSPPRHKAGANNGRGAAGGSAAGLRDPGLSGPGGNPFIFHL